MLRSMADPPASIVGLGGRRGKEKGQVRQVGRSAVYLFFLTYEFEPMYKSKQLF